MQHFKNLIIANRALKREKKSLELKYRMMEYSQESYREGYTVALQMALQSGDGNIVQWGRKVLSKLIREKMRRRKNYSKAVTDQDVFRHAKDVVFDWLKRNTDEFDIGEFKDYCQLDLLEAYQARVGKVKPNNEEVQEGAVVEEAAKGEEEDAGESSSNTQDPTNSEVKHTSEEPPCNQNPAPSPNPLDFLEDEDPNDVDIY